MLTLPKIFWRFVTLFMTVVICFSLEAQKIDNIARNPDFEDKLAEWQIRHDEGTVAKIEEDNKEKIKGKASVFIEIDVAKGEYWHIALFQEEHFLKAGLEYTFAVWAKGEKPRPMVLYVEELVDPWDEFGREEVVITQEWAEYWSTFTVAENVPAAWLRIALGESDVNLWIDSIRFHQGAYVQDEELAEFQSVAAIGKLTTIWGKLKRLN